MLFVLLVFFAIILIIGGITYCNRCYDSLLACFSWVSGIIVLIILLAWIIISGISHTEIYKNSMQIRYEELEKNKHNEFIINDIMKWNTDIRTGQKYQRDFWYGPFVPNIYDDFKTIEIDESKVEE